MADQERIRSARIRLKVISEHSDHPLPSHSCLAVFDTGSKRFRFDNEYGGRRVQTIRMPDREVLYITPPGNSVGLFAPGGIPDVEGATPFDWRALGLATLSEFEVLNSYEELLRFISGCPVKDAVEEPDGKRRVTWAYSIMPAGTAERSIWFDKERGFSPVRFELVVRGPKSDKQNLEPLEWGLTTWEKEGDVWIPRNFEANRRQPKAKLQVDLAWEDVNKAVSPNFFQVQDLATPDITLADYRLGEPKMTTVGEFEMPATPEPVGSLRIVLVVANVLVVVALTGYLIFRKRSRQSS